MKKYRMTENNFGGIFKSEIFHMACNKKRKVDKNSFKSRMASFMFIFPVGSLKPVSLNTIKTK